MNRCPVCLSNDTEFDHSSSDINFHTTYNSFDLFKCYSCKAVFIHPKSSDAELERFYPAQYNPHKEVKLDKSNIIVQRLLKQYPRNATFSLIDLGCGSGSLLYTVKKMFPDAQIFGVDFSQKAIDNLNAKNINGICKSIYDLKIPFKYDVIIASALLEHLSRPRKFIDVVKSLSHKGTKLFIHVPDTDSNSAKQFRRWWVHWDVPRHQVNYCEETLRMLFKDFDITEITKTGSPAIHAASWLLGCGFDIQKKGLVQRLVFAAYAILHMFNKTEYDGEILIMCVA